MRAYVDELRSVPGRLKVALTTVPWSDVPVDPQVAAVTANVGKVLDWLGHHVTEASPPVDAEVVIEALMLSVYATGAAVMSVQRPNPALWEAVSRSVFSETEQATALGVMKAVDAQNRATRPIGRFFTQYDILVTPTIAQLPAEHGMLDYNNPAYTARSWLHRLLEYGPFTAPFNVSGNPAISLPLGQSREGLPIGVQLVAAHGREDLLIQMAAQLEQAVPWSDRAVAIF